MDGNTFRYELVRVTRFLKGFMHETVDPICKKHDITMQHLYILMELSVEPGQTASQLSDSVGILRTNFTQVCHKMEEKGLIERRPSDSDKRSVKLYITDKGNVLRDTINEDITRKYAAQFEAEPEETFSTIIKGFDALRDFSQKFEA